MIENIDITLLEPHPDNPRKDIGDVSELAESIKASGILQNLTVVPHEGKYRVIIGHRRLAAAKKAGLTSLPCTVCDMDYKTQLATMLSENMQRVDLTVVEQVQGIQMMLDLGESVQDVAGKTGLYAIPVEFIDNVPVKTVSYADGKTYDVYEVRNGLITIKDKQYPIKLPDGYYIIRKLTVTECCRLQTLPDDYCKAVSQTQAYKGLGNGWTAEVIIHLLNHALKDIPKDEQIVVLSMYDGIGTGRYCLDKMGFTNVRYYAYEIDKYAKIIANDNYPDINQCGNAFDVRNDDWRLDND